MNEAVKPATGRAEGLRAAIIRLEAACRTEGIEENGPLGIFVQSQKEAMEQLAGIVDFAEETIVARIFGLCEKVDQSAEKFGSIQVRKLEALFKGGEQVLDMAREAARTAVAGTNRTQAEYDKSVARIAKEMSEKLLAETQKWLVLKQTDRNRKDARRLAIMVSVVVVALVLTGFQFRAWQDAPATEALARCAATPIWVRLEADAQPVAACKMDQLAARELTDLPKAVIAWLTEWLP